MKLIEKHPMSMIVVGVLGISLSAIFARYSTAPSIITAASRLLWTVVIMTPIVLGKKAVREELASCQRKEILLCTFSGIFFGLHLTTWFESLNQTSVASSTAIVCSEVIWVALGFCLFLKGRISAMAGVSILVTVGGSLLIAFSDYSAGGNHLFGDALALMAAIFSAVYTLIGRQVRRKMSTWVYTYIVYVACALFLCIAAVVMRVPFFGYGPSVVVVGFLLSVCSTLLGHSIFSWCLKFFSPSFVSASKLCEPVVASVFALLLFGEVPAVLQVAGGLVTIGGVLLYSHVEKKEHEG